MNRKEKGAIRHRIYLRADGHCEKCGHFVVEEAGEWTSMHLHHIKSRGAGGDWSDSNLVCLCIACHMLTHSPKSVPKKELVP